MFNVIKLYLNLDTTEIFRLIYRVGGFSIKNFLNENSLEILISFNFFALDSRI